MKADLDLAKIGITAVLAYNAPDDPYSFQCSNEQGAVFAQAVAAAVRAENAALLDSIEGMPSVEEVVKLSQRGNTHHADDCLDVRELMLSAFAKQTAALQKESDDYFTKLQAVAKLPGKWRETEKWMTDDNGFQTGRKGQMKLCVEMLEAALGTPPAVEPVQSTGFPEMDAHNARIEAMTRPVPAVDADPYAELKAAHKAGKAIQYRVGIGDQWADIHGAPTWVASLEHYRIKPEPLPADPWAAEKAAHARGERIERRHDGGVWEETGAPSWCDFHEYRIAPSPAPAGKLSYEQLGEIGAMAAAKWLQKGTRGYHLAVNENSSSCLGETEGRTAFARAVAEAVRAQSAGDFRQQAQALYEDLLEKKLKWLAGCEKVDDEMAKENSDAEVADFLREIRLHTPPACHWILNVAALRLATLRAENAKQAEEIARLKPRPVSVKPTREDADRNDRVLLIGPDGVSTQGFWSPWNPHKSWSHWLPCNLASYGLAPSPEETERAEFEAWWIDRCGDKKAHKTALKEAMFDVWQAARASAESQSLTQQESQP